LRGKHGFEVREQAIPREFLYLADENLLTGRRRRSPGALVDRTDMGGTTRRSPKTLQAAFFGLFRARRRQMGWLAPSPDAQKSSVAAVS